jgi:hypothetical protein
MKPADDGREKAAWYHCGLCGEVFPGALGAHAPRACLACGGALRREASASGTTNSLPRAGLQRDMQMARRISLDPLRSGARPHLASVSATKSSGATHVRGGHTRRSRKGPILVGIVVLWMLGLVGLGVNFHRKSKTNGRADRSVAASPDDRSMEDVATLRAAMPFCQRAWFDFLQAGTPEARAQSAKDGYLVVGAMQRYYAENSALNLTAVPVQRFGGVIKTPAGLAIETLWSTENQQYEVVFFNQKGEWRMDWKAHVRHSDIEWPLHLAGLGEDSGEFRLFVRERQAEHRSDGMLSVVFYPPRYGRIDEHGPQSPEFLVPRDSEAGRRLVAVLANAQKPVGVYQSKLAELDPKGMARVRVKVTREEAGGSRTFKLDEVLAGHWLDIADPGIGDLPAQSGSEPPLER